MSAYSGSGKRYASGMSHIIKNLFDEKKCSGPFLVFPSL